MKATRLLGTTLLLAGVLILAATGLRAQSQGTVHGVAHGAATWTSSGALIVAGGTSSTGVTDELVRIVPGQTSSTHQLVVPRADHTATLLPDGTIAVSGGPRPSRKLRLVKADVCCPENTEVRCPLFTDIRVP